MIRLNKIALLTERLKTGFGVDLVVHEQAQRLARDHGFQVAVFAAEIEPSFQKDLPYSTIRAYLPLVFNPITQDWIALRRFREHHALLMSFQTFIVHTPCFYSWIPLLKMAGKNVIAYHYGNSPSNEYAFPRNFRQPIMEFTQKYLYYQSADRIVTISNYLKQQLPSTLQGKTETLLLGKDHTSQLAQQLSDQDLEKFRQRYFIAPEEKIITYVGRIDPTNNPYKNTRILLKLHHYLRAKGMKNYRILGLGVVEGAADQEFMSQGVTIIPRASNHDVVCALRSSAVYVSGSLWEGFNLPLLEAQAVGVPVVAYHRGAHPEVVAANASGFLVGSQAEFMEYVARLLTHEPLRKRMAKNALLQSERFSWDTNVAALAKIIKKVTQG